MDIRYLLDSSALLAVFQQEPGADEVTRLIDNAAIHAVQLAEVVKKLVDAGFAVPECTAMVEELGLPIVEDLTAGDAYKTGYVRQAGLSLGDRICLAAANRLGLTAVTADRAWVSAARTKAGTLAEVLLIR